MKKLYSKCRVSTSEKTSAKERVILEAKMLKGKIDKLSSFLSDSEISSKGLIKPVQRALLEAQLIAMNDYYDCLRARLEIWGD